MFDMSCKEFIQDEYPSYKVDSATNYNLAKVFEIINPEEFGKTLLSARRVGKLYAKKNIGDFDPDQVSQELHLLGKEVDSRIITDNFKQIDLLVEALDPLVGYHTNIISNKFANTCSKIDIEMVAKDEVKQIIGCRLDPGLFENEKYRWGKEISKLVSANLANLPFKIAKDRDLQVRLNEEIDGHNTTPECVLIEKEESEEIFAAIRKMPPALRKIAIEMVGNRSFNSINLCESQRDEMKKFLIEQIPELGETFRVAKKVRKSVNTVGMVSEDGFPIFDNIPLEKVFGHIISLNLLQQKVVFYYVGYLDTSLSQNEFARKHNLPGINTVSETLTSSRRELLCQIGNNPTHPLSEKGSLVPHIEQANSYRRREYSNGNTFPETAVARQSILVYLEKSPNVSFFEEKIEGLYHRNSPRSYQIVKYVIDGLTNREIAEKMSITESCVKSMICTISKKIAAASEMEFQ